MSPIAEDWPRTLTANGNVVAWQEAVIGPEISNYRITEVRVEVGDTVRKGQVLARIASDTVASELAEARAAVAELAASAQEAGANAQRGERIARKRASAAPSSQPSTRPASIRPPRAWLPPAPGCKPPS